MESATITGNTGNPIQDSVTRGGITTVIMFVARYAGKHWGVFDDSEIADFSVVAPFVALFLWGIWDRKLKGML